MRAVRIALLVGLALAVAGTALAQPKGKRGDRAPGGPGERGGFGSPFGMIDRAAERLNLSAEQKEKVETLKKEFEPKIAEVQKKLDGILTAEQKKAREDAIAKAKEEGKTGRDLFQIIQGAVKLTEEQQAKQKEVRTEMMELYGKVREKLMEVLTDEQKKLFQGRGERPGGRQPREKN